MAEIYAMSDIHGFYESMQMNLQIINLMNTENKLIFCGDYIDYGPDSCKVLYQIKDLMQKYPSQVIAIKGNHETMFLEFLYADETDIWTIEWLSTDKEFATVKSFIPEASKAQIEQIKLEYEYPDYLFHAAKIIKNEIFNYHKPLIHWMSQLPYYYETDTQIFVHAGIDEEAEGFWGFGTPDDYFVSKFPATFGNFYKDIIAGHISTSALSNEQNFHHVFWDGQSHFYIDGETNKSGHIPILKYEMFTGKYFSFRKESDKKGNLLWVEYLIK